MKKHKYFSIAITLNSLLNHAGRRSIWTDIKEALTGTEKDFTQISLRKAVFLLSIPMVMEMVMESAFAITDIYFVSRLGTDAIATVGITESMMSIIYAIAFGISMATTALISRRIGEKNPVEAAKEGLQALITGIIISIMIAVPGMVFARQLLVLMGANNQLVEYFGAYTIIMFGGNVVIMLLFICNALFRGAGDAAIAMRVLFIANGLNIILCPLLIYGIGPFPAMGIAGAAVATNIGRGTAVAYQLYILFFKPGRVSFTGIQLEIDWKKVFHLINLSLGAIGQNLIATTSWVFLVRILSGFGSNVVAGYTVALRIVVFTLLPSWGLANAASTLVGQNLGAKQPDRAEKTVWSVARINTIIMLLFGLVLALFPGWFIGFFTNEPAMDHYGIQALRIIASGSVFYGLGMVLVQAFNGSGDTRTPGRINLIAYWGIQIPLAWILARYTGLEQNGVFLAIVIAESAMTMISYFAFKKGKWKEQQV
jgi:putative MATE family efflux protein